MLSEYKQDVIGKLLEVVSSLKDEVLGLESRIVELNRDKVNYRNGVLSLSKEIEGLNRTLGQYCTDIASKVSYFRWHKEDTECAPKDRVLLIRYVVDYQYVYRVDRINIVYLNGKLNFESRIS